MVSSRLRMVLSALLLLSFSTAVCWAQKQSSMDADKAAIKQSVAALSTAWNAHDPRATTLRYVEDGDFSSTTGANAHGWKELEEHYNTIFTTTLKTARRTFDVKSIRFLTPEIASVDINWQMTNLKAPDGSDAPPHKGLITLILAKHGGDWPIVMYHESAF